MFLGGLLGAMLVFFFSGLAIKAVGKAAQVVIQDVRAQFKEHPGIMQGDGEAGLRPHGRHRHARAP